MLGIEIVSDRQKRTPFSLLLQAGPTLDRIDYQNGLVGRCMRDVLGFSPPLIIGEKKVDEIADRTETSLKQLKKVLLKSSGSCAFAPPPHHAAVGQN
ncbi:hypothetical protein [Sinorhizobium sp. BG8]|uniref:hypothetical protein n=1 Tax=Sinorhizobium sp. BG8 TaxID=2613773 RepID=UPI00193E26B3|nr:hypothetical protein [Sinorhizobium sp. BG8]QRM57815.1 hypothetical protein F3Y30_25525 [Sinorhizobium sp. BG8]